MPPAKTPCLLDTSVLINFLVVDRGDLLASHPAYRFLITPHVRDEVTAHYPIQVQRLLNALSTGALEGTRVEALEELETFANLESQGLGLGEAAAIAAAIHRRLPIAIQDKVARKKALAIEGALGIVTTEQIIVDLIKSNVLNIDSADVIKAAWECDHKFRVKANSFGDLL